MKIGDRATLTLAAIALLILTGCAIRKPVQAMYCEYKTPDGRHCAAWAKHPYPCTSDVYGDCKK